jgi:hypothetical protein
MNVKLLELIKKAHKDALESIEGKMYYKNTFYTYLMKNPGCDIRAAHQEAKEALYKYAGNKSTAVIFQAPIELCGG